MPPFALTEAWGAQGPMEVYGGPQLDSCPGAPPKSPLQWAHLLLTPQLSASEAAFAAAAHDVYLRIHSKGKPLHQWGEAVKALVHWLETRQQQEQQQRQHRWQQQAEEEQLQWLTSEVLSLLGAAEVRAMLEEAATVGAPVLRPAVLLLSLLRLLHIEGEKEEAAYKIPAAAALHLGPLLARAAKKSLKKALPHAVRRRVYRQPLVDPPVSYTRSFYSVGCLLRRPGLVSLALPALTKPSSS